MKNWYNWCLFAGCAVKWCPIAGVDFRVADLTGVGLDRVTSIEGAYFTGVVGLGEAVRAMLVHRSSAQLDSWNSYTRTITDESLNCDSV